MVFMNGISRLRFNSIADFSVQPRSQLVGGQMQEGNPRLLPEILGPKKQRFSHGSPHVSGNFISSPKRGRMTHDDPAHLPSTGASGCTCTIRGRPKHVSRLTEGTHGKSMEIHKEGPCSRSSSCCNEDMTSVVQLSKDTT